MNKHLRNARRSILSTAGIGRYASKFGLQPADRIKQPIFQTGLTKHHSIYLGIDQYGQEWVSENHKIHGVRLVKAEDFFKEDNCYTIVPFQGRYQLRIAAVKRALSVLGKPYELIQYNCEHYASYVQTGKAESTQIITAIAAIVGLILIGAATEN